MNSGLADGGDGIEDANLEETVANATILRLFELRKWCQESVANEAGLRTGELSLFDKLFLNEMNILVAQTKGHYQDTSFKLALKSGFYDFVSGRIILNRPSITNEIARLHLEIGTAISPRLSASTCIMTL